MRIIKERTLKEYCGSPKYHQAAESLRAWVFEVKYSDWKSAAELKAKYKSASILSSKRVVFNIKGNDYRLIVDVEYKMKIVFVVWFGTHSEYNRIDPLKVNYDQ